MKATHHRSLRLVLALAGAAIGGCASDAEPGSDPAPAPTSAAGAGAGGLAAGSGGRSGPGAVLQPPAPAAAGSSAAAPVAPSAPAALAGAPAAPPVTPPATPMMPLQPAPGAPPAGPPPAGAPQAPAGAEDGPAGMPVIAIPDVACGGVRGGFGAGLANFMLDGREMIVTYPCDKHAGAPASFILNLHGTTPVEQHFYQHGYFSAHQFAASHNLIIVTPSSVVQQWGNMDNGEDEPHLMKIIDWVYANLNGEGKFDIKAMWVGGHSWGGGYTARFGCKPELADKVKGLIMMSGGGVGGFGGAACADKISAIITTAEGDSRMPSDQSTLATSHGCAAGMSEMILQNQHTFWSTCMPGFVHANYYMLGKEHATSMDREVVESIANWIKLQRQ